MKPLSLELETVSHGMLFLHLRAATVWAGGHLVLLASTVSVAFVRVGVSFRSGWLGWGYGQIGR